MQAEEFIQWRNQHESQEFPFVGSSSYFTSSLIVDLSIAVFGVDVVWVSSMAVKASTISGVLTADGGLYWSFQSSTFGLSNSVALVVDPYGNPVGSVVFGPSASDAIFQIGNSVSIPSGVVIVDPCCIVTLSPNQVSSISINKKKYGGFVKLVEGEGISIGGSGNNVVINAIGNNSTADCCLLDYTPVKSINSTLPIAGGIVIRAKDVGQPLSTTDNMQLIKISPISNGIEISLAN